MNKNKRGPKAPTKQPPKRVPFLLEEDAFMAEWDQALRRGPTAPLNVSGPRRGGSPSRGPSALTLADAPPRTGPDLRERAISQRNARRTLSQRDQLPLSDLARNHFLARCIPLVSYRPEHSPLWGCWPLHTLSGQPISA